MSCLFDSLEYFLNISSKNIRSTICDYLENNNVIVDGIDTKDLLQLESENYISEMRKISTWGGAIEIKAAANIWNLEIIVKNIRNKKNSQIHFIPNQGINNSTKKIYLTWNGFHYEPIRDSKNNNNTIKSNIIDKKKVKKNTNNNTNNNSKNKKKIGLFELIFGVKYKSNNKF